MSDETEIQKDKQRQSKEMAKHQKQLKVDEKTIKYEVSGNKILKLFKKNNGSSYSIYVGTVKTKDKESRTGREIFTTTYIDLCKKGLLPDAHKVAAASRARRGTAE